MKNNNTHIYSKTVLFFLLLVFSIAVKAQDDSIPVKADDSDIQQQLENAAENINSEEIDYTSLLDAINYYKEHRINLNNTSKEELQQLIFLNDIQINNLLQHIKINGKLITIYELQGIDGFDLQTIRKLLPYVKVTDNLSSAHFGVKEMFKNGQHTVQFRYARILEKQTGFTDIDSAALYKSPNSRYIGSPDKLYARYRFQYGTNVSWGVTAEKDQGELFFKNRQRYKYDWYEQSLNGNQKTGFDFYSAHFYLHNIRFVKSLAIGDYQVTFGQGLTAWTAYAFGKSANILAAKKSARGISPYTSVDENKFLRGAAATVGFGKFEFTGFYSRKRVDANISDTLQDGEIAAISSLQETGYHSTSAEIADKDAITQTIYGGNVSFKTQKLSMGITTISYELDKAFNRSLSTYNFNQYAKETNINVGFDYNLLLHNFNFFGEQAISKSGGMAYLNGAVVSLDPRLMFTMVHRYYQPNYQNLLSNGFAESSTAVNEKGLYMGMIAKPINAITLTAYYDRFEFPWLKFQIDAPSRGNDYIAQINYTPSKKVDMYFRIHEKNYNKNNITTTYADLNYILPVKQDNYRFDISYSVLPSVRLKNRVELVNYKVDETSKTENGYLVYQDVSYNKPGKPLSVTLRYALFETDTYNARIYTYESDMPGAYSILSYYYRGSRFYVMLDYNITRKIELWVRYSQTFYDNQNVISAGGLTEINGNTKSEIKAQLRFKF